LLHVRYQVCAKYLLLVLLLLLLLPFLELFSTEVVTVSLSRFINNVS
jgi:hypothetical protein